MKYILTLFMFLISVINCFSIPFRFMPMGYIASTSIEDGWELSVGISNAIGSKRTFVFYIDTPSDIRVDYGDGSISNYTTAGEMTHTYANIGTYTILMSGSLNGGLRFGMSGNTTPQKILSFRILNLGINNLNNCLYMFDKCQNISTFSSDEFLNQTNIHNLDETWNSCYNLTNAPEINHLTAITNIGGAWGSCSSLNHFPDVYNLTNVNKIIGSWFWCVSGTNFPEVNTLTNVTSLFTTWTFCSNAPSFPAVFNLTKNTSLGQTWARAYQCTNFPEVNSMTNVTDLDNTWLGCGKATNFPPITSLTKVTRLWHTWDSCTQGKTFPEVNTLTNIVGIGYGWTSNTTATNFPSISVLSNITYMVYSWQGCTNARTFPTLFPKSTTLTNVSYAFQNCTNISGAAPELWNVANFPNITVYTNCFNGLDPLKISNWNDIPSAWK